MRNSVVSSISAATLLLLALTACSDNKQADSASSTPAAVEETVSESESESAPRTVSKLPDGNVDKPLSEYAEWQGNNQIMFLYYALTKLPVDYAKVMDNYSEEYRNSNDNFRKNDLKNALKDQIDAEVASAAGLKYLKTTWSYFTIHSYDFDSSSFPQTNLTNNGFFYWNDSPHRFQLTFTNGDEFKNLFVKDEATARKIEDMRSKYSWFNLNLYTFVQAADPAQNAIKVQVLAVELTDQNGNVLIRQFRK